MNCPKCKKGKLEYYANNFYVGCNRCDFRNGFLRTMLWSKEKRARFHNRYCRWLLFRLKKYGTGKPDFEGYDARRRLQLHLESEE